MKRVESGTVEITHASSLPLHWLICTPSAAGRLEGADTRSSAAFTSARSPATAMVPLGNASPKFFPLSSMTVIPL